MPPYFVRIARLHGTWRQWQASTMPYPRAGPSFRTRVNYASATRKLMHRQGKGSSNSLFDAPCWGDSNLFVMPCAEASTAVVVDRRAPKPAAVVRNPLHSTSSVMLTGLAMTACENGRPILACAMDDGTVTFHDVARTHVPFQLSKTEPIVALDVAPSSTTASSVVAVAGLAGMPEDVLQLPKSERGRVCLLKATLDATKQSWRVRERARMLTCRIDEKSYGKPTASVCRLQPPNGRLIAVGGWDKRVRIYDRSNANQLAILRGHRSSVLTVDCADDAHESGLLASCDENEIHVWKCFAKNTLRFWLLSFAFLSWMRTSSRSWTVTCALQTCRHTQAT